MNKLVAGQLPGSYADIVRRIKVTHVQLIYRVRIPAYHSGRMALIGDAGSVAQPFIGSGVFKGYNNVIGLLEVLATGC